MATLLSLGVIAAYAVGTTTSIVSGVQNYQQQKANARAQEDMFNYNARLEEREADNALKESQEADQRQRVEQARLRASQRALYAKSGASMTAGSPLAVLGETAATQQIESSDLLRQGATEYNQHMTQRNNLLYQGKVAKNSVNKNQLWTGIGSSLASGFGGALSSGVSMYTGVKRAEKEGIIKW